MNDTNLIIQKEAKTKVTTLRDLYQEEIPSEVLRSLSHDIQPEIHQKSDCHLCRHATWFTRYRNLRDEKNRPISTCITIIFR